MFHILHPKRLIFGGEGNKPYKLWIISIKLLQSIILTNPIKQFSSILFYTVGILILSFINLSTREEILP